MGVLRELSTNIKPGRMFLLETNRLAYFVAAIEKEKLSFVGSTKEVVITLVGLDKITETSLTIF
jgi:hypothetical protein